MRSLTKSSTQFIGLSILHCVFILSCHKEKLAPVQPAAEETKETELIHGLPDSRDKVHAYFLITATQVNGYIRSSKIAMFSNFDGPIGSHLDYSTEINDLVVSEGDLNVGRVWSDTLPVKLFQKPGGICFYWELGSFNQFNIKDSVLSWSVVNSDSTVFRFNHPMPVRLSQRSTIPYTTDRRVSINSSTLITNFDECIVCITPQSEVDTNAVSIRKLKAPGNLIELSTEEAQNYFYQNSFPRGRCNLIIKGVNYYHQYVRGKLYLFVFTNGYVWNS